MLLSPDVPASVFVRAFSGELFFLIYRSESESKSELGGEKLFFQLMARSFKQNHFAEQNYLVELS